MGWTSWSSQSQSTAPAPPKLSLRGSPTRWHRHTGDPTQRSLWVWRAKAETNNRHCRTIQIIRIQVAIHNATCENISLTFNNVEYIIHSMPAIIMLTLSVLGSLNRPLSVRPAMAVRRCSWRRRGSITADHAARVSAIPAPATGCRFQREAGAVAPSGCVRPATDREGHLTLTARVRPINNHTTN